MKKIGIPGWSVGENSFGATNSYLDFISRFGTPVILTPADSEDLPKVDMVLAPGGADLLPASYGARPSFRIQKSSPMLEHFDKYTLPKYIEQKVPIFAICRSMQRIWAMYGGKIEQHNGWHDQSKHPADHCHELHFTEGNKDYDKLIKKVTSRHHQCADASDIELDGGETISSIPNELEVVAYAKAGVQQYWPSVVEIFRHKELPIFAVQFHPEDHDASDELSTQIITEFLT